MGDENPIRTLGDYSKPSHEGYRNTIELFVGNNVCEIDRAASGKLYNKNVDESWEIVENLALYDHEGWNDMKEFLKLVKAISTPQGISKTHDRRLLELEDQINFLLKGSQPTLRSSTHTPHAYVDVVHSNPRPQSHNEPPKPNPFTFRERTGPSPQPQALGTTFEARVRDYMATHSERMERFENAIFKQPRGEEERSDKTDETLNNIVKPTITETEIPMKEAERNNETKNKPIKKAEEKEVVKVLSSRPVEYYLKHKINEKLIEGLVDNNSDPQEYIIKKEDIGGNFEIPCSIGGLKHVNALVDQGSDVNVMPYSTYMKLTDEIPAETDIKLSLASHSYIYPLGIVEDVLVEDPDSPCMTEKGVKNDIEPIAPTMTVNRLVLEWEEKIKLHLERGMEFNQWRSNNFKGKHPTLITTKGGMEDEGEVTLYLMRISLEVLRKFHWTILG
ncbi:hypothetical protein Tco_1020158 [Tanacetum coccineum]|uniref:MAK10-like protein n=1 Tax=Tanacetum coccineum TaxID=301880 RepID=A0ABQ5G0P3_9ASTR